MNSNDQTMKSAVSPGIGLILWITIVICALSGGALMFERNFMLWNVGLVTVLVGSALPLWMLFATFYRLESDRLVARSGPFRWRVNYSDIRSVKRCKTLLAGPALSFDRLLITYGDYNVFLVISPISPDAFQKALESRMGAFAKENGQ